MYIGSTDGKDYYTYASPEGLKYWRRLGAAEEKKLFDARRSGKKIIFHGLRAPEIKDPDPPDEKNALSGEAMELQMYLKDTDWYAIRFADTGEKIPDEVREKRRLARERISEIRELIGSIS